MKAHPSGAADARAADPSMHPDTAVLRARLDRLPWTPFHGRILLALTVGWALAGLALGAVNAGGAALRSPGALGLGTLHVATSGTVYLVGEAVGALACGWLTGRIGRRRVLLLALVVFLLAGAATAGANGAGVLLVARLVAGLAAGAQYATVLAAVMELVPTDRSGPLLASINGMYWFGALLGAAGEFAGLDVSSTAADWRIGVVVAPALALLLGGLPRLVPESPAWLVSRGRSAQAMRIVELAERDAQAGGHQLPEPVTDRPPVGTDSLGPLRTVARMLRHDRPRTIFGFVLTIGHAFCYSAVFFTLVPAVTTGYHVGLRHGPEYLMYFALANLLGSLVLGPLFRDSGHRSALSVAYLWSGGLVAFSAFLVPLAALPPAAVAVVWCAAFFIAAPATGCAILRVTDGFDERLRPAAARLLFAVGQAFGALGPLVFGALVATGHREAIGGGLLLAGIAMGAAGGIAALLEGKIQWHGQPTRSRFTDVQHIVPPPAEPLPPPREPDLSQEQPSGKWSFPAPVSDRPETGDDEAAGPVWGKNWFHRRRD